MNNRGIMLALYEARRVGLMAKENFYPYTREQLIEVIGVLSDHLEATLDEMHARELHHFETEKMLADIKALATRDATCICESGIPQGEPHIHPNAYP